MSHGRSSEGYSRSLVYLIVETLDYHHDIWNKRGTHSLKSKGLYYLD
jgi:hypothetical protein